MTRAVVVGEEVGDVAADADRQEDVGEHRPEPVAVAAGLQKEVGPRRCWCACGVNMVTHISPMGETRLLARSSASAVSSASSTARRCFFFRHVDEVPPRPVRRYCADAPAARSRARRRGWSRTPCSPDRRPPRICRVDVDDRHRLRLVDDEVPAVFQRNGALRQLVKLLGDAVFAQHLPLALVERDLALAHVCPHPRELHHPLVGRLVAHIDARDAAAETVAHDLEGKIEFAVHHVADGRRPGRLLPPNSTPVSDIPIQS